MASCGASKRPLSTRCADRRLRAVERTLDGVRHGVEQVAGRRLDRRRRLISRRQGLGLHLAGQRTDLGDLVVESLLRLLLLLEQRQLRVDGRELRVRTRDVGHGAADEARRLARLVRPLRRVHGPAAQQHRADDARVGEQLPRETHVGHGQ